MGSCSCGCGNEVKEKFVMACSGGSNVGQISNSVMVKLKGKKNMRPYCLAGVGADLSGFILTSKENETVLIDGCAVGCAKKIFEKNGITPTHYFVVTEMGIEKSYDYDKVDEDSSRIANEIVEKICNK